MTYKIPSDQDLTNILKETRRIAVVGISDKPDRPSYRVSKYLLDAGYEIIPINPTLEQVHGIKAVKSLSDIEGDVDMINVFRRSEETVSVAEAAARTKAKVLWLQLGIYNDQAAEIAQHAGQQVVMDRCILIDHQRLLGGKS